MLMAEQTLLRTVRFADLTKWSPNVSVFDQMQTNDPLVPLTKLLTRAKVPVDVEDDQLYKRIKIGRASCRERVWLFGFFGVVGGGVV